MSEKQRKTMTVMFIFAFFVMGILTGMSVRMQSKVDDFNRQLREQGCNWWYNQTGMNPSLPFNSTGVDINAFGRTPAE